MEEGLLRLLLLNSDGKELDAASLLSAATERLPGVKLLPDGGRFWQGAHVDV